MPLRVEESFEVRAPADLVWEWLVDARQVAGCLPGATLRGGDEGTRSGTMEVKVGPTTIRYEGEATITRDGTSRRLNVHAAAHETAGTGVVRVAVACTVAADDDGPTRVHVVLDLDGGGRMLEFGRAQAEAVAGSLVRRTADCLRATVEPRASAAAMEAFEDESLTLSGAFREHPMLKDTATAMRARVAPYAPPRTATAVPERRETTRVGGLTGMWRSLVARLFR